MKTSMSAKRNIKKKIYIFTNGEIAEPDYFRALRDYLKVGNIVVKSSPKKSPDGLVDGVIVDINQLKKKGKLRSGDDIWIVFDVDDYISQNEQRFSQAMDRARKYGLKIGYSNRCFELWFLLHFQNLQNEIPASSYDTKLKRLFRKELGFTYSKNKCDYSQLFTILLELLPKAKKHAKQIYTVDITKNPSTAIHFLVEDCENLL